MKIAQKSGLKFLAEAVRKYHLPDFSHWKNHAAFEAAFAPPTFHFRLHLISA